MNKRTWWKAAAALVIGGAGLAAADAPKVEQAVWSRATAPAPAAAPAPTEVVPAAATVPVKAPLPEQTPPPPLAKPYPLPPKSSSDPVVLPEFRPAPQPQPVIPAATLPQITQPPVVPTTSAKIPVIVQPPIPPAIEEVKPLVLPVPKPAVPEPVKPVLPPPPITVLSVPEVAKPMLPPPPIAKIPDPVKPMLPPEVETPALTLPPITKIPDPVKPTLPSIPEAAPPAQPVKSADVVKPLPPAVPDFNLRPTPGGNSVKTDGPAAPMIPAIPPPQPAPVPVPAVQTSRSKPVDVPMPATEKFVFPLPEKFSEPLINLVPQPPAIPATLPKPAEMPESPAVPPKPVPSIAVSGLQPVPMILPGVPTALERPLPPKNELNTIPQPGADPMILKQTTLAAAIGGALALMPMTPAFSADPVPKTADEKLADAQKEIKRLGELLDGRKDTDGKASPYDVGAVEEIKRLKNSVFDLKEKVIALENQVAELKKSTTSLKPSQTDPMAGKGVVRVENDYPVEITIVVNTMSYRVPANTKLDVTVGMGDFTYQLLNSGTGLAPVKSPIKEKEIVRLRIK